MNGVVRSQRLVSAFDTNVSTNAPAVSEFTEMTSGFLNQKDDLYRVLFLKG